MTYTPQHFVLFSTSSAEASQTTTVDNATSAGDTLVIWVDYADATTGTALVTAISDTQGNTYTSVTHDLGLDPECEMWISSGSAALGLSDQVTVNLSSSEEFSFAGMDFPGAATVDRTVPSTATGTSSSVATGTLTYPYEYVLAVFNWATAGISSLNITSGPTTNVIDTHATSPWLFAYGENVTATTSVTCAANWTGSVNHNNWAVSMVLPPPSFPGGSWPAGQMAVAYSSTVGEATVYAGSGTWSIASGSLPPGLSLTTASGLISGTPTTAGTYTFRLEVVDGNGITATTSGTIDIATNLMIVPPSALAPGILGLPYTAGTYSATDGASPYQYALLSGSGSMAPGMSIGLTTGAITGTPTETGTFTFQIQVVDSDSSTSNSAVQTMVVTSASSGGNISPIIFPNNLLSKADSQMLTGYTWSADQNASVLGIETACVVEGSTALEFESVAAGDMSIHTGLYPVKPSSPYIASACILPTQARDVYVGIEWYTSSSTLIGTGQLLGDTGLTLGNSDPSSGPSWQPVCVAATSPSNAAKARLVLYVAGATGSDEIAVVDMAFFGASSAQILIDWFNPVFVPGSSAGQAFMDATPFVRMDTGIAINRGRQDAVSEMQPGTATFSIDTANGTYASNNTASVISAIGGTVTLGARCQINLADQNGEWWTRFDGPIAEIDYQGDNTGNTMIASVSVSDVMASLNREDSLSCWTKEQVLSNSPAFHWSLDDVGNAGGSGVAVESSGNNGPPLRAITTGTSTQGSIAWQSGNGGIETLANSVAPGLLDGSEFWPPQGQYGQATSQTRGLDAGVAGPYLDFTETNQGFTQTVSTPLPTVYFTPYISGAGAAANEFTSNPGYGLVGELPPGDVITTSAPSTTPGYTFECWFTIDPGVFTDVGDKVGPFTVLSLGSSRTGTTLVAGVYLGDPVEDNLGFGVAVYASPPNFQMSQFGTLPAIVGLDTDGFIEIGDDTTQLPHHLVITITPGVVTGGFTLSVPVLNAWLDNLNFTTFDLAAWMEFDTIVVGSAYGGRGAHWGGVSLVSVYDYQLSSQQIATDCQMGQYGMWEQTTDNCVEALATFANIPGFWNGFVGQNSGLTITDYVDITGSNPLTEMQLFEQAELGLLFTNAAGQLMFHTRDWRMGYSAPDMFLPIDTFDSQMNLQVLDQYMINEEAINTTVFQAGASWVNTASQQQYGSYATNGIGSPLTLPLISFQRASAQLGVASYVYWPDPNLTDYAQWEANSRATPRVIPGALEIDLKTLVDTNDTTCTIALLYGLEIDNMIAPSPDTLPLNYPNQQPSLEWFIEGINETFTTTARTITFYTSPAASQRAWCPGDTTYGQLDFTALLGISQADNNQVQASGKDVAHDSGPPYWPPTFTTAETLNAMDFFTDGDAAGWTCYQGTLTTDNGILYPGGPSTWSLVGTGNSGEKASIEQSPQPFSIASNQIEQDDPVATPDWAVPGFFAPGYPGDFALNAEVITVAGWVYSPAGDTISVGVDFENSSRAYSSTTVGAGVSVPAGTWVYVTAEGITVPTAAAYAYPRADSGTNAAVIVAADLSVVLGELPEAPMNNPNGNGHGFVGGLDMRGLTWNLQNMIQPPMLCVSAASNAQAVATGANATPNVYFDTVYIDTQGGMGLIPGYPNWYCVTVPGFYDIDASVAWAASTYASDSCARGWIVIAPAAAQNFATGTTTPWTNPSFANPVGEQKPFNGYSRENVVNGTVRTYLGLGDMVTVGTVQNTGSTEDTGITYGGAFLSMVFRGLGQTNDQIQTTAGEGSSPTKYSITKYSTESYSYYGSTANSPNARREASTAEGYVWQGTYSGQYNSTGSQYAYVAFDFSAISSAIGTNKITAVTLRLGDVSFWYGSGGKLILGYATGGPFGTTFKPGSETHFNQQQISYSKGQTKSFSVGDWCWPHIKAGTMSAFTVGNDATKDLSYYGYFYGGSCWELIVDYEN